MTSYAVDVDGSTLIRTWPTGRGLRAAMVSVLPAEADPERSLALADVLTGLSSVLWRCYTQEHAHRVGRALRAVGDPGLREAVRAEVEAELEAVEMAERG